MRSRGKIRVGVIGLDHVHGLVLAVRLWQAGATIAAFHASGGPNVAAMRLLGPRARSTSIDAIIEDPSIDLIVTAAIPRERGDIAVFKLPKDNETDYIKRVIGLPGDRIQMLDGRLYINGEMVQREPASTYRAEDAFGRTMEAPRFTETLPNGVSYHVIERDGDRGFWDNTEVYQVPDNHYFMMGDNRDNSTDSRDLASVGFVPNENFVGRAEIIFFSIQEGASAWRIWDWPLTVRWDRIFDPIR